MDFAELADLQTPSFAVYRQEQEEDEVPQEPSVIEQAGQIIAGAMVIYRQVSERNRPQEVTLSMEDYQNLVRENIVMKKELELLKKNNDLTWKDRLKLKVYELMPVSMIFFITGQTTFLTNVFALAKDIIDLLFLLEKIRTEKKIVKTLWEIGMACVGYYFK